MSKTKTKWKVSAKYYRAFREAFIYYRDLFGLKQYRVDFIQEDIGLDYAQIRIGEEQKIAVVVLNTYFRSDVIGTDPGPVAHARHECMHLLLNRLSWLATLRYLSEEDIKEEDEALAVILTRAIE